MHPLIEQHREELYELYRRHRVTRLEVFGSAAADPTQPKPRDFDFLVEFERPMEPGGHVDSYFGLLEALEQLFDTPVDLVEPGGFAILTSFEGSTRSGSRSMRRDPVTYLYDMLSSCEFLLAFTADRSM